jgi:hypothetical protein
MIRIHHMHAHCAQGTEQEKNDSQHYNVLNADMLRTVVLVLTKITRDKIFYKFSV